MTDHVVTTKRSEIMRSVGTKDTGPELVVRQLAHRLGLRYRLHDKRLPGRPDLVFPCWKTVVFVHGCFWHRHKGCAKATTPKSNVAFWMEKFDRNIQRDAVAIERLTEMGWRCEIVWQCETTNQSALRLRLMSIFPGNYT